VFSEETGICSKVICSLNNACVGLFAQTYKQLSIGQDSISRKHIITKQFKSLLLKHSKTDKSVKDYAAKLDITAAYLNEAVKAVTGLNVSYWIQQMVLTEAKRLLSATDNTVKEIAHQLGFDDHAYFNRYFSNFEKESPLQFRKNCRK
jgi:AraC-like DNA-binding protein